MEKDFCFEGFSEAVYTSPLSTVPFKLLCCHLGLTSWEFIYSSAGLLTLSCYQMRTLVDFCGTLYRTWHQRDERGVIEER